MATNNKADHEGLGAGYASERRDEKKVAKLTGEIAAELVSPAELFSQVVEHLEDDEALYLSVDSDYLRYKKAYDALPDEKKYEGVNFLDEIDAVRREAWFYLGLAAGRRLR